MKRSSLILLSMAWMFVAACGVASDDNQNRGAGSNSNAGGPRNTKVAGVTAGGAGTITVAVVVCYDANGSPQVRVTEPIYVSPKNSQKVRWCVYNDLDMSLESVSITAFNSGGATTTPLCSNTPNLTTGQIAAGNLDAVCTEFCAAAASPAGTSFQYTVTAKPEGQKEVTALGPRVIIQ